MGAAREPLHQTHAFRQAHWPLLIAMVVGTAAVEARAQSFAGLGLLPGGTASAAFGVSWDGTVVVGWADTFIPSQQRIATRAVRWTSQAGVTDLGTLPGGAAGSSWAQAVSADGSVVAGASAATGGGFTGFRWTAAGMVSLGPGTSVDVRKISADGLVICGTDRSYGEYAFKWTSATGRVSLGALPLYPNSEGVGISRDGSVIVGECGDGYSFVGCRWTAQTGMVPFYTGYALATNLDGSVVSGTFRIGGAFRWRSDGSVAQIDGLGSSSVNPTAVSDDGRTVTGWCHSDLPPGDTAFLWREGLGTVDLNLYLIGLGVDLTGWHLDVARGMNAEGTAIVGEGTHDGHSEGWIARLPVCYPNCDGSAAAPVLNVNDFVCFLNRFATGDLYANCDGSTAPPVLNVVDFFSFLNRFAAGCS